MENDLLGKALLPIISGAVTDEMKKLDIEGQIKTLLNEVAENAEKVITVKLEGAERREKLPLVHKQFEDLLQITQIKGLNVLLTGGAGLSKSTAVEQCAKAFQLEMGSISFSNQTTKTDLLGFVDANGIYRKSSFVDAFQTGKVFLADEMDACSANVLVLLNSAISNGFIETPDNKVIHAHDNFRFIGTANTNLRGAKNGFSARNKLDSATIDRFCVIEWELDEDLEEKLTNNKGWLTLVRKCREVANKQLEGVTITPRSSYDGAKLLRAGIGIDKVIQMTIIKAMGEDEKDVLLKAVTENMKIQAVKGAGQEKPKPKVEAEKVEEVELDEMAMDDVQTFEQAKEDDSRGEAGDDDFEW